MLRSLIALCLARRPLVLVAFAAFLGIGYAAFTTLNIEAYPDPAPPIIELIAQWPGQSPEEVERYVTIRSEEHTSELQSLRHLVCRLLLEKKKSHEKRSPATPSPLLLHRRRPRIHTCNVRHVP